MSMIDLYRLRKKKENKQNKKNQIRYRNLLRLIKFHMILI
ncbi:unnamed protein product [Paramecium sonneborni]|uniref:Uncharacterized protein n=1 Tax=Paramecium sonneborni TaxID=65129 RepID=A0A8S1LK42_9CILI|nr:unnamed protein product [Paramecium sonneborni]